MDGFQYKDGVLQFFPTTEGYVNAITAGSVAYNYVYNLTDHLGNVRVSYAWDDVNSKLKTVNEDHYYPFGLQHKGYNKPPVDITIRERERVEIGVGIGNTSGSANYKYKYNGKELQDELNLNLYDFEARNYMPDLGRTTTQDPMAEMYYSTSSYAFFDNNPVFWTDPTGMTIEPGSQKEWDRQTTRVERERDKLQGKIDRTTAKADRKGWSAEKLAGKLGNLNERVSSLNNTISTFGALEESSQVYALNSRSSDNNVSYDTSTGNVMINYSGTALFVHETTHAGQFESGDIAFDSNTGNSLVQDVFDEIAGYKAQFAYKPNSVSRLSSISTAKSFGGITSSWVQGLKDGGGNKPYMQGGSTNTGISPVNVNSTRDDLIKSYPHLRNDLGTLPASATLKSAVPSIYYKR
ncbi:RHS repeat protein [Empedobacter brevis]|uniref:RHS repeat protein n=1 Tax=Empedobacter brevis TaxID=247 RepID=UPI003340BCDD